ncbi:cation transporter [Aminipila butyrica]|uniref:Cation transporter n=1 Tax=Aminipila butyrica TaxID=433296 RepID=A0A858BWR8_9FIRM|nr:cation transporter [Aminipila butyrica]QIB68526.1 cation transporter [Aminipila butyrica]
MNSKLHFEKRILTISMVGSILFMLAEGVMAYVTRSNSILMDCLFDFADLIMIGPFLLLIPLLYKPVTEKRPYGYSQVESLFVIIKCCILLVIIAQLVMYSVQVILRGGNRVDGGLIAAFEIGLSAGCIAIYTLLRHYNKSFSSPSIKADLYMWRMDIISSLGVGLAFLAQGPMRGTPLAGFIPYVDPLVAIAMALFFIVEPVKMMIGGIRDLILFAPEEPIVEEIRQIINRHLENYPYTISFLDVIQTGRKAWVEVYLKADEDQIRISQLQQAHGEIKRELRQHFEQIYVELIPDSSEAGGH